MTDDPDPVLRRAKDLAALWNEHRGKLPECRHLRSGRRTKLQRALRQSGRIRSRWANAIQVLASAGLEDKAWATFDLLWSPGFLDMVESQRTREVWRLVAAPARPKEPVQALAWVDVLGEHAGPLTEADRELWRPMVARDQSLTVEVPPGQSERAAATLAPLAGRAGYAGLTIRELA